MWQELLDFVERNEFLIRASAVASVGVFLGSLILLPLLISRLPADYFATPRASPTRLAKQHPFVRLLLLGAKNLLGVLLLLVGFAMLVLPGQGLTILAAVILLDFPGKRRLELALVRRPRVLRGLNWIRRKTKHLPLDAPPPA